MVRKGQRAPLETVQWFPVPTWNNNPNRIHIVFFASSTLPEDTPEIHKAFCPAVQMHSVRRDVYVIHETGATAWKSAVSVI